MLRRFRNAAKGPEGKGVTHFEITDANHSEFLGIQPRGRRNLAAAGEGNRDHPVAVLQLFCLDTATVNDAANFSISLRRLGSAICANATSIVHQRSSLASFSAQRLRSCVTFSG